MVEFWKKLSGPETEKNVSVSGPRNGHNMSVTGPRNLGPLKLTLWVSFWEPESDRICQFPRNP